MVGIKALKQRHPRIVPLTRALGLGWLVAFIACLLAFSAIAAVSLGPASPPLDRSVTAELHGLASPTLDVLMRGVTDLGSTPALAVLVGLAVVVLVVRRRPAEALFAVTALGGTLLLNETLKRLFERPRPALDWAEAATGFGFPSGHAMNATVVLGALALIVWRLHGPWAGATALTLSLALTVLIGSSRIYLGVHWTTDVVGGFLAGGVYLLVLLAASSVAASSPSIDRRGSS
jgi:undecaprenyl-diphosphatase